jgi:hypothetical protein
MGVERLTQLSGLYFGQIEKIIPVPPVKKVWQHIMLLRKICCTLVFLFVNFFTFILCIILNLRRSVKVTAFI